MLQISKRNGNSCSAAARQLDGWCSGNIWAFQAQYTGSIPVPFKFYFFNFLFFGSYYHGGVYEDPQFCGNSDYFFSVFNRSRVVCFQIKLLAKFCIGTMLRIGICEKSRSEKCELFLVLQDYFFVSIDNVMTFSFLYESQERFYLDERSL